VFAGRVSFAQVSALSFRPIAADYSQPLDRLILIAGNPNQLHIYSPQTQADTTVNLSKVPLSLAVSPDGLYAAVGHDSLVSYVNLSSATVEKTFNTTVTAPSVLLSANWIYVLANTYNQSSVSLQIATGFSSTTNYFSTMTGPRLNTTTNAIYATRDGTSPNDIEKIDISAGPMGTQTDSVYHGDYSVCGGVFLSADGARIHTGCGTTFRASTTSSLDMRYMTAFTGLTSIRSLAQSNVSGIAAIPGGSTADGSVFLYDGQYQSPFGQYALVDFQTPSGLFKAHGKWVFFSSDSSTLHVVMQADTTSGLLYDYAVQSVPLNSSTLCGAAFAVLSANAIGSGSTGTVDITAAKTCPYRAVSQSSWIQVASGGQGSGNGILKYMVRPNPGGARSGQIVLGDSTFTVNQAAAVTGSDMTRLSYDVLTAEYSSSLGKVVLVTATANELHVYDPESLVDQPVSLPKTPLSLAVSPDGLYAAVGHDGFVSFVNLTTATLDRVYPSGVRVQNLALGPTWIYLFGTGYGVTVSVNIASGTVVGVSSSYIGNAKFNTAINALYGTRDGTSPNDILKYHLSSSGPDPSGQITSQTDSIYHGDYPVCGPVFFNPAGNRIYSGCRSVFRASSNTSLDMRYLTTLTGTTTLRSLSESDSLKRIAIIENPVSGTDNDRFVWYYESIYLNPVGQFFLTDFQVGASQFKAHGKFVFFNAASTAIYAVTQADATSQLLSNAAVQKITLGPPSACNVTLGTSAVTVIADGSLQKVTVASSGPCQYQAVSAVPWIQIVSGGSGSGDTTITFIVRGNLGPQRIGTFSIGNSVLTVTQSGNSSLSGLRRLPYNVVESAFNKPLNKLVLASAAPNELHLFDPATFNDTLVALPLAPLNLSLSADGLYAVVGHDGWVSYVDLMTQTATTTQVTGKVSSTLAPGNGYLYLLGTNTGLTIINLGTGAQTTASGSTFSVARLWLNGPYAYLGSGGSGISKIVLNGASPSYITVPSLGCGAFWLTEDGNRLINSCAKVYRTSLVPSQDLEANGSLSGLQTAVWVDESSIRAATAALGVNSFSLGQGATLLHVYGDAFLNLTASLAIPRFPVGASSYAGFGKFVFWNSDASKLVVVVKADTAANLLSSYGVIVMSPERSTRVQITSQ